MRRLVVSGLAVLGSLLLIGLMLVEVRQRRGNREAAEQFTAYRPPALGDFGATKTLSILPLIDWHVARPELRGELGLSYLIETDEQRILLDVAHNARGESPSPLEHNMEALGVALDDVDTVFITHNHLDHVGGFARQRQRTFSIGLEQRPLPPGVRAFVPIPMSDPVIRMSTTIAT